MEVWELRRTFGTPGVGSIASRASATKPDCANMLANLIDTEPFVARQLVMKHRGRTRLPASIRDHDVAYFIAWRVEQRMPMKAAKADALTHFKISNATMNRAWSKYGKETTEQVRRTLTNLRKMDLSRS